MTSNRSWNGKVILAKHNQQLSIKGNGGHIQHKPIAQITKTQPDSSSIKKMKIKKGKNIFFIATMFNQAILLAHALGEAR